LVLCYPPDDQEQPRRADRFRTAKLCISNSQSGRHRELDQIAAVGYPSEVVDLCVFDGLVEHTAKRYPIHSADMSTKTEDPAGELIHDDENPVRPQDDGFTPKQIDAPQAVLWVSAVRGHWGVENRTHHLRDTRLQEAASRICRNPCIFALLRSFALNLMRFNGVESISLGLYDNALSLDRALTYEGL